MALIIKGDMPKGCGWDCHYVAVNKYYDERDDKIHKCVFCALNHSIRYKDSGIPEEYEHARHPNCPIIGEIPNSHGDLIDEDEFRQVIYREIRNHKEDEPITMILKGLLWEMDNAPVILEATE